MIGDSAFPLTRWLLTPFRDNGHLTRRETVHNTRLSSERIAIEHAFGILKGRWRRLQFINTYSVFKAIEISLAGCILHNFCLLNFDYWDQLDIYFDEESWTQQETVRGDNQDFAKTKRDNIANMFC